MPNGRVVLEIGGEIEVREQAIRPRLIVVKLRAVDVKGHGAQQPESGSALLPLVHDLMCLVEKFLLFHVPLPGELDLSHVL